ncbi:MAG: hypothetical protein AAF700_02835 [Pseudomonadota bacterium]
MSPSLRYWRWHVLRQVPLALGVIAAGVTATVFGADLLPDRYTATTRLMVEAPAVGGTNRVATETIQNTAQIQAIEARLMTNDRLSALSQQLGRETDPTEFQQAISFDMSSGRGKPTSLAISVTATDGAFAAAAANALAEQVLAEHRLTKSDRAESALVFYREEVAEQKQRLDTAFEELLQFKSENAGALPEDAPRYYDQRKALLLQRASKGLSVAKDPLSDRLEMELRSATTLYSDAHPRVRSLESQIKRAEPQVNTDAPQPVGSSDISQIDAALARIPANALRLEALQNDHDLARRLYEEAVARLEAAAIEERITLTAQGDRITIVEAALLPELPAGPQNKIILALGCLISCLLGLALAVLRIRADQVVRRPQDLMSSLQIKPYAVIPRARYA